MNPSPAATPDRRPYWRHRLERAERRLELEPVRSVAEGTLVRMVGLTMEAVGCRASTGAQCMVRNPDGSEIEAEVVGFDGERLFLMPTSEMRTVVPNARVIPTGHIHEAPVGDGLLGRVIDGAGEPLDGKGTLDVHDRTPLTAQSVNPMERAPVREPLDVGVRAINALLSVGRGQRMGLFAGSGVGKSVLLGMMTRFTSADVVVVGLIGERGREVKDFIENILGEAGRERAVVIAAPADATPVMRLHGAAQAHSIAEYFRDQGRNVLLLMDSLTRYAQAQREIALAVGEPPATKGYPPSVFAKLPGLVERSGNGREGGGSITAFYTVLTEGDDQQDPIADASRAILDGHIVLSRRLAEGGQYPAIDIEASISRVMPDISDNAHQEAARRFKQVLSRYEQNRDLISIGAYNRGSDPNIDQAIDMLPRLQAFLSQGMNEPADLTNSIEQLQQLFPGEARSRQADQEG
ncbi:MAG: flagellar protein export ATPase FliI [Thiohalospira sp.]